MDVLIRGLDSGTLQRLKQRASGHGRSLQAELKAILEAQVSVDKAKARSLAARIRKRIGMRTQTDSGQLQHKGRLSR